THASSPPSSSSFSFWVSLTSIWEHSCRHRTFSNKIADVVTSYSTYRSRWRSRPIERERERERGDPSGRESQDREIPLKPSWRRSRLLRSWQSPAGWLFP